MNRLLQSRRSNSLLALLGVALVCAALVQTPGAGAYEAKPRLGPNAIPIQEATRYFRTHRAPDYWALAPFYLPQDTDSACSVASIAMLLNALRGVPARADIDLVTQAGLRAALHNRQWTGETAENGTGVTFAETAAIVSASLKAYKLESDRIEVFKPAAASHADLHKLRSILAANERSATDIALVYFNQGVLTGDWDGPHLSPIGAYDAGTGRVLVMDVDRRYYVPYWSPVSKLLESMLKPSPAKFGRLGGETGGIIWVRPTRG
jgi:hypothetical protein